MRKLLKFLHTLGAVLLMGAMASLLAMLVFGPAPAAIVDYASVRVAMGHIATWVYLPGMVLTLIPGLLGIAFTPAFHNAGWVWLKALTGILVFEWSFAGVVGPMQQEAALAARVLAHDADPAALGLSIGSEQGTIWVMLAVAAANVALGVWRPRLTRLPAPRASSGLQHNVGAEVVRLD